MMPALPPDQAAEVTAIHSAARALDLARPLVSRPPFCAAGPATTVAAMIGGSPVIRPGIASLAHRGVLYLTGAPEFGQ